MKRIRLVLLFCFVCRFFVAFAYETVNPIQYGVLSAKTGVERYQILLKCHKEAVSKKAVISYKGIKYLALEIPADAQSIPLTSYVDFDGVTINVLNNRKRINLFTLYRNSNKIDIYDDLSSSRYTNTSVGPLKGRKMIVIEELSPWTERKGYNTVVHRKDLILLENGHVKNSPVLSYQKETKTKCSYVDLNEEPIVIKNIVLNRDPNSSFITNFVYVKHCNDIIIDNITINTPKSNLSGDGAIGIANCSNVNLSNVTINGTYSQKNMYGYGVQLDNILNLFVTNMNASGNWGVYGTNNINTAIIENSALNRFDIHCYGRDVRCYNCKFSDLYNQFSSVYGDVYFEKCSFTNFTPVLIESSYNAYTPFDLTFRDCTFNFNARKNHILTLMKLDEAHNSRPELSRKALPNIQMKNCIVNLADDVKEWYIVNTGKVTYKESLDHISKIEVNQLKINGSVDYKLFSTSIKTTRPLKHVRKRVKLNK